MRNLVFAITLLHAALHTTSVLAAPCDIYGAAGTPCVGAHSMVRALYSAYSGPLYQVQRLRDNSTLDIFPLNPGGFANAAAQNAFCNTTTTPTSTTIGAVFPQARSVSIPPLGATINLSPSSVPNYSFRHCDAQGFVTSNDGLDHEFKLVQGLNGVSTAISFQSINFPTYYIAPITTAEFGRVGIVEKPDAGDASWLATPGANGSLILSCMGTNSNSPCVGGTILTVGTNLTGSCSSNYEPPAASVYLMSASASPSSLWTLVNLSPGPCVVSRIYDQSPSINHLDVAPAGGAVNRPDSPVDATRAPLTVNGGKYSVYGAYFQGGQGYRIDNTTNVAINNEPETIYMVTRGDHYNDGCCFDYGNAETNNHDDGAGTMECVYFGTWNATSSGWCGGSGFGPWVMADLENGLWACGTPDYNNPNNTGFAATPYVVAMVKGGSNGFALKGGDANSGSLQLLYDGPRPPGYQPMKKQGAIILGIGGDNSDSAIGSFYEGCILSGYSTDEADNAVHADIVSVGYM